MTKDEALDRMAENARELGLDYEPHKGLSEHLAQATNGRVRIDPASGDVGIGTAPVQDIDWKDMYEKEKRRSEMWVAKYEKDIGPLEYAVPVAAPVQEPVATIDSLEQEIYENTREFVSLNVMEWLLNRLNTTPPAAQRPWVGLTQEEIENCYGGEIDDFARAIEAKLKEKNT